MARKRELEASALAPDVRPRFQCHGDQECGENAIYRVMPEDLNLCLTHYVEHFKLKAQEWKKK